VKWAESMIDSILRVVNDHVDSACCLRQECCNEKDFREDVRAHELICQCGLLVITNWHIRRCIPFYTCDDDLLYH
jgi:hypothetical protein